MLKKNLFYNSILSISQLIFPLITFPYSSRILGPVGIGTVNFIDSFTQYFTLFAWLGIPIYGVREISKHKNDPEKLNKIFNEILLIHIISTCIFSTIFLCSAFFLPALKPNTDLVLVGITMMFCLVFSAEWLFVGLEQFAFITLRTLIVRCLAVVCVFYFLKKGSSPFVYYAITASSFLVNGIFNVINLRKHVKINFSRVDIKMHLRPMVVILTSTLAISVYLLMDNIILGFMKGEEAVGIYSTAVRIVKIPFAIIGAITTVMVPQISRAYSNQDFGEIKELINKSFSFICVISLPIFVGLYVAAPFLIKTFAGDKFQKSIDILQILSPLVLVIGFANIFTAQLLPTMGKEKYLLKAVTAGMVFSLLTNLVLIPYFSYKGAAVTNLLTECIVSGISIYFVRKFIHLKLDFTIFIQCLTGAALFIPIAYLVRAFNFNYFFKEGLVILLCTVFYAVYLWVFVKSKYITNFKNLIFDKLHITKTLGKA